MTEYLLAALADTATTLYPGRVITKFGIWESPSWSDATNDYVCDMAIMPDGRIVVAGSTYMSHDVEFALARYNADGTPDLSFSTDGRLTTKFGSGDATGRSVDIVGNGRIIMTGDDWIPDNASNMVISRYTVEGSLDRNFSGDGWATFNGGHEHDVKVADAIVLPDESVILAGELNDQDMLVAKFRADGTPDTRFGQGGERAIKFSNGSTVSAATLQADGKILIVGTSSQSIAVARLNANGTSDITFSSDGLATVSFDVWNSSCIGSCVALQTDGKIVIAGSFRGSKDTDIAVVRLNPDGSLDARFSGDGRQMTDFSGKDDRAYCITIQPDGKILVGGYTQSSGLGDDFALVRYNVNGTLDSTFSDDGKLTIDFEETHDRAKAISVLDNGKIILAGEAQHHGTAGSGFAMARVNADGSLDRTFGAGEFGNTPPYITSSRGEFGVRLNRYEGETAITTVTAKDVNGDAIRYSIIGGADRAVFSIDETSGALSFVRARDFEAPTDVDKNNRYEVIVSVSDGRGGSDSQVFTVSVLNLYGDITGGVGHDHLVGTGSGEPILGLEGNDTLEGKGGNDHLIGGSDIDTAVYETASSQYRIAARGTKISSLSSDEGSDTLTEVERLAFTDVRLAFDIEGHAGTVARYLGAVLGKSAVSNKTYVGMGLKLLDGGAGDDHLMQLALESVLGPSFTPAAEIDLLYRNLTGRPAAPAEIVHWTAELENGALSGISLAQMAAQLDLNAQNIGLTGLAETGLPYIQP